jgi:hypothetical protein
MLSHQMMRTTLDIDEDVLAAAKELAAARKTTAGKILSELVRKALLPPKSKPLKKNKNGVPLFNFPRSDQDVVVTNELVRKLRDEME